jgi:TPR repeat protein
MNYKKYFYPIFLFLFCFVLFQDFSAYAMIEDKESLSNQRSPISQLERREITAEEGQSKLYFDTNGIRIDLHGESLEDAKDIVMSMVKQAYSVGGIEIHFICGRGQHANKNGKRAVIWKTIPTWLSDSSIASFIDHYEKGLGTYNVILKCPKDDSPELKREQIEMDVIKKLAHEGNPQVQLLLAEFYIEGKVIKQNYKKATSWLKEAANQELGQAQLRLGYMTAMGKGIAYDPIQAIEWYEKSGKNGISNGYLNIAMMYFVGEGVEQNYTTAYHYYRLAAKLENPRAYNILGIITRKGLGVLSNDEKAVIWDRKGAEAGEPHAMVNLGCMLIEGKGTLKNEVEGTEWLKKAAEAGIPEGQLRYGISCINGTGVLRDYEQAAIWLKRAAAVGPEDITSEAQYILYDLIKTGRIKPSSTDEANNLLEAAAKSEHPKALFELGGCYRFGSQGFSHDWAKAKEYYLKASSFNHGGAFYALFEMRFYPEIHIYPHRITQETFYYLDKAAQLGSTMALIMKESLFGDKASCN